MNDPTHELMPLARSKSASLSSKGGHFTFVVRQLLTKSLEVDVHLHALIVGGFEVIFGRFLDYLWRVAVPPPDLKGDVCGTETLLFSSLLMSEIPLKSKKSPCYITHQI